MSDAPAWLVVALTAVTVGPLAYAYGQGAGKNEAFYKAAIVASGLSDGCSVELNSLWDDEMSVQSEIDAIKQNFDR